MLGVLVDPPSVIMLPWEGWVLGVAMATGQDDVHFSCLISEETTTAVLERNASLSLFLSLSLSLSLSFSLSVSLTVSLCLSLSLCLSVALSLSQTSASGYF